MKILITGGFGFIGSHLVEQLYPGGDEIHIVDDLSTSIIEPTEFLSELGNPSNVTYDIMEMSDYLLNYQYASYDQVYHLASIVGPAGVLPESGTISRSVINDATLVAERCLEWGARLVDVSTSEIYGGGTSGEDDPKVITSEVSARLEYAVGKLAAEVSLINLSKTLGLDVVIVRPFNIAGARQSKHGGFVLPRLAEMALEGKPLTVFGDGSQIRAFTHVKDMAAGLVLAMQSGRAGEAYNVGDALNKTTILSLAQRIVALSDSASEIVLVDPKTIYGELYAEANDKLPIATKAEVELKWVPFHTLDDIILDTLRWLESR